MAATPLIDIEIIIHRAFAALEGMPLTMVFDECVKNCYLWAGLAGNAGNPFLCFSGRGNFRKHLSDTYKAHRSPKPEGYDQIIKMLKDKFRHMEFANLEADDLMGILQTSPKFGPTRIVSIDKDMATIPGWLINPDKYDPIDWAGYREISVEEADLTHLHQTVIGDTADGFKGIPGAGPKAAEKVTCWDDVVALGEKKGVDEDYLILQARLAHILRREDYDHEARTIKLWHPREPQTLDLNTMEVV